MCLWPILSAANMFAMLFCAADMLLQNLIRLRSGERTLIEFDFLFFHEETALINALRLGGSTSG